jgi:hypothetical protein
MRTCQIQQRGKWNKVELSELKKDDEFRLFDNGVPVFSDKTSSTKFIAATDAYLNKDGIWVVGIL